MNVVVEVVAPDISSLVQETINPETGLIDITVTRAIVGTNALTGYLEDVIPLFSPTVLCDLTAIGGSETRIWKRTLGQSMGIYSFPAVVQGFLPLPTASYASEPSIDIDPGVYVVALTLAWEPGDDTNRGNTNQLCDSAAGVYIDVGEFYGEQWIDANAISVPGLQDAGLMLYGPGTVTRVIFLELIGTNSQIFVRGQMANIVEQMILSSDVNTSVTLHVTRVA